MSYAMAHWMWTGPRSSHATSRRVVSEPLAWSSAIIEPTVASAASAADSCAAMCARNRSTFLSASFTRKAEMSAFASLSGYRCVTATSSASRGTSPVAIHVSYSDDHDASARCRSAHSVASHGASGGGGGGGGDGGGAGGGGVGQVHGDAGGGPCGSGSCGGAAGDGRNSGSAQKACSRASAIRRLLAMVMASSAGSSGARVAQLRRG